MTTQQDRRERITSATPEQWAQIEQLRVATLAAQCDPISNDDIRKVVGEMYALMGAQEPKHVVVCDSPVTACMADTALRGGASLDASLRASLRASLHESLDDSLWTSLDASLRASLRASLFDSLDGSLDGSLDASLDASLRASLRASLFDSLDGSLRASLRASLFDSLSASLDGSLWDSLWASLDASLSASLDASLRASLDGSTKQGYLAVWWRVWAAWYAGGAILGVQYDQDKLRLLSEWSRCCPYAIVRKSAAIIARNPVYIGWKDGRIHDESGMAVRYADGWGIYAIDGVTVPAHVVTDPSKIMVEEIQAEKNAERARVMRQRFGEGRYLADIGAKVIDADFETARKGAAARVLLAEPGGQRWLVGTDGSTSRVYYMAVASNIDTCRKAHESLCGFPESKILNKS